MNNAFCTLKRNYLEGKIVINIIPTLSVMDTYDDYNTMIKNYIKSNSNLFRCNTTRFDNNTYIKSIHTLKVFIHYKKYTIHIWENILIFY